MSRTKEIMKALDKAQYGGEVKGDTVVVDKAHKDDIAHLKSWLRKFDVEVGPRKDIYHVLTIK